MDGHNAAHRLHLRGGSEAVRTQIVHPNLGSFGGTDLDGVAVRFSGGAEADDLIVEHVERARDVRNATVVTDDRGLARRVLLLGAAVVGVRTFFRDAPESNSPEKPESDGLTPADFGLPATFDPLGPVPPTTWWSPVRRSAKIARRKGRF